ncbi:WxcM-like domain-containing protein [bacterium]|nr:WxcM-like domain-containing protein [bacterium]
MMEFATCRYIDLPKRSDDRGSMTYLESLDHIPFPIRQIGCIRNSCGKTSTEKAYKQNHQVVIALRGLLRFKVDDGLSISTFLLDKPSQALLIPCGKWCQTEIIDISSVGLVIHSMEVDQEDEINSYEAFLNYRKTIS